MAKAAQPDMVLCDIGLPGVDGYEAVRALRAAAVDGMQIVAVSGYARGRQQGGGARVRRARRKAWPQDE